MRPFGKSAGDRLPEMEGDTTGITDLESGARRNPVHWLIFCGAVLIAGIVVGIAMMVGNFRERALRNSERELENTVLLLARHFDQQLEDFEVVQKDLVAHMQLAGIVTGDDYRRAMSGHDVHMMLKAKISAMSYVGGINLFDSDGRLINSSETWPLPAINVADRAYFKTFKSGPQSPVVLVEPVHSRITGVWTTVLARKLIGPDGEFLFAVNHSADVVLRDAIPSMPSFQARVTGSGDGHLNVSAHDPESDN